VPVGGLAVEPFSMANRPADQDLQRPRTGDPDVAKLAAGEDEQVVGVVGGATGGDDEPLVAAVAVGINGAAGDQAIGADQVRAVGQRQVSNAAAGQQDADVPLARLAGGVQLGVGQQLVAGLVTVEVTGDARDPASSARQGHRVVGTGPGLGVAGHVGRGAVRRARFAGDRCGGCCGDGCSIWAAACGAGLRLSVDRAAQLPSVTAVRMAAAASAWRGRMTIALFFLVCWGGAISSIKEPGHAATTARLRPNGCLKSIRSRLSFLAVGWTLGGTCSSRGATVQAGAMLNDQ
jgi:hypothetical protein